MTISNIIKCLFAKVQCGSRFFLLFWAIFSVLNACAAQEIYSFQTKEQQIIFENLTKKLRCVTCPNQSLSDSYAPVAESMRAQIHEMIWLGKSEAQIEMYFLERYGDYVIYKPSFTNKTLFLWLGPLIFFAIGIIFISRQVCQMRSRQVEA